MNRQLPWLIVFIVTLIVMACTVIPMTTTVDTTQEYAPSDLMRVDIFITSEEILPTLCKQQSTIGCTIWINKHSIVIYVNGDYHDVKHALHHELQHVVYGPKHKEDR